MPIARRKPVIGRQRRRILDPERPLFVTRRIAAAHDPATGVQSYLVPGASFDATSVTALRLRALFAGRFVSHDPPRGMAHPTPPLDPEAPIAPPPPAVAEARPKRPRAGA
jgi:hypothetical protein